MNGPPPIGELSLAAAAALLLLNAGLSWWLGLGLGRRLLVAAVRTVVQLSLLGLVLVPIFGANHFGLTSALAVVMVVLASFEALRRVGARYPGAFANTLLAMFVAASVTSVLGSAAIIRAEPWWQPRVFIPLVGMILGNALTGVTLGLQRCLQQMRERAREVELLLGFGASPWEAARPIVVAAARTALVPILNSMSVVGLVTIPGMMTGQLLGGTEPMLAARYQIVIMFLIAGATALGAGGAILLSVRSLFDDEQRLRLERLATNNA
jgi:putative ABC transport system permease protein